MIPKKVYYKVKRKLVGNDSEGNIIYLAEEKFITSDYRYGAPWLNEGDQLYDSNLEPTNTIGDSWEYTCIPINDMKEVQRITELIDQWKIL